MKPRVLPPELVARLGRESDAVIARDCGVAATTVFAWRKARGIGPYQPHTSLKAGTSDTMSEAELDAVIERQRATMPRR
jgi:hypothetical protein